METITPKDEKVKKETLIVKSDGTTEKLEKEKRKAKQNRALTSQEESILLPLLQGLLSSSGDQSKKFKHENTPFTEKEATSTKNSTSDTNVNETIKSMYNGYTSCLLY